MVERKKNFKQSMASFAAMIVLLCGFVIGHEGTAYNPYRDMGGVWTICHGETVGISYHTTTQTPQSCSLMLRAKLTVIAWRVDALVEPEMSVPQWMALTDFAYNLGLGALAKSTLLKRINAGDPNACNAILDWMYVASKDCRLPKNDCGGIVRRRKDEWQLCMKASK